MANATRRCISITMIRRHLSRGDDKRWQVEPDEREININGIRGTCGGVNGVARRRVVRASSRRERWPPKADCSTLYRPRWRKRRGKCRRPRWQPETPCEDRLAFSPLPSASTLVRPPPSFLLFSSRSLPPSRVWARVFHPQW